MASGGHYSEFTTAKSRCHRREPPVENSTQRDKMVQPLDTGPELPPSTTRWSPQRKAVVVNAVRSGALSLDEACRRYLISTEEFSCWQRAIDTHGVAALRVTRLQLYRNNPPRK
jgi:hypothetical protein